MTTPASAPPRKTGLWMALIAAILGWMFDGFEMGLFPLAARPALREMLADNVSPDKLNDTVGLWIGVMAAGFLVGASAGGVIFGWLGDRLGRVRAMTLSVLTYAIFSGLCGFSQEPWHLFFFRFLASMGMGGEWSLGVSLVMELWPSSSRAWLAGMIGAASNVGFMLVALINLVLSQLITQVHSGFLAIGLPEGITTALTRNNGWRLLMICGVLPALLTFFIRLFVPESEKWEEEHSKGTTRQWSSKDLLAVLLGTIAAMGMITVWAVEKPFGIEAERTRLAAQIAVTVIGLTLTYLGFTYPIRRYIGRTLAENPASFGSWTGPAILKRLMIGATLSGVALLGTWASIQNAPPWADALAEKQAVESGDQDVGRARARAASFTQIASGFGAVLGTIGAALLGNAIGRRSSYLILCIAALASSLVFFRMNTSYGPTFLATVFLAGGLTASFYGWLPLYLPELFPTRVRAFGQGFAFNFGRVIAAVGALQFGYLTKNIFHGSIPEACTVLSFVYVIGMAVIWLAPETHNQPLPE
jgi:MFS transporter, SHS family, sialic acid transporter